jgi:hypothetical protein
MDRPPARAQPTGDQRPHARPGVGLPHRAAAGRIAPRGPHLDAVPGRAGSVGYRPDRQGHQYAEEHHHQAEDEERALPTAPRPRPAWAVDRDGRSGTVAVMVVSAASAAMVPTRATAVTAAAVAAAVHKSALRCPICCIRSPNTEHNPSTRFHKPGQLIRDLGAAAGRGLPSSPEGQLRPLVRTKRNAPGPWGPRRQLTPSRPTNPLREQTTLSKLPIEEDPLTKRKIFCHGTTASTNRLAGESQPGGPVPFEMATLFSPDLHWPGWAGLWRLRS